MSVSAIVPHENSVAQLPHSALQPSLQERIASYALVFFTTSATLSPLLIVVALAIPAFPLNLLNTALIALAVMVCSVALSVGIILSQQYRKDHSQEASAPSSLRIDTSSLSPKEEPVSPTLATRPTPLINDGNNCCFNTALQMILSCEKTKEELRDNLRGALANETYPEDLLKRASKQEIKKLLQDASSCLDKILSASTSISARAFRCLFERLYTTTFSSSIPTCVQRDADEIVKTFLYALQELKKEASPLSQAYQYNVRRVKLGNSVVCATEAAATLQLEDEDAVVHHGRKMPISIIEVVPPSHPPTFEELLTGYFEPDNTGSDAIKGYLPDRPDTVYECHIVEEKVVFNPPDYLIINISRGKKPSGKNSVCVPDIPLSYKFPRKWLTSETESATYDLMSFSVHLGSTLSFGHYYAYVKKEGVWYKCNDASISQVTEADVKKALATQTTVSHVFIKTSSESCALTVVSEAGSVSSSRTSP